jgi:hypothetical protein
VTESIIFWDVTPYSPVQVHRRFEDRTASIFKGQKVSKARNQKEAGSKMSACPLLVSRLASVLEDGGSMVVRIVSKFLSDYMTLHSSVIPLSA